jgi:hypothetical protein
MLLTEFDWLVTPVVIFIGPREPTGRAGKYGYKRTELVKPHCMRGAIRNHQVVAFFTTFWRNYKFHLPQKDI